MGARAGELRRRGGASHRLGVLLGVGIDHLDRDGLDARDARGHLRGEDAGVVVNRAGSDEHALGHLSNLLVKASHDARQGLDERDLSAEGKWAWW